MRKHWIDNIRWTTVVVVVIYHVFYMYNSLGIPGVVGKITNLDVQYYDLFQYIAYPWFMMLLFIVSGISSRLYLEKHSDRDFIKSRTTKLLVPSTIGLFAFQFIQGYVNASLSGALETMKEVPLIAKYFIMVFSGTGVLWYIQLLWLFSLLLVLVRKIEKDRLFALGEKANVVWAILLCIPVWGMAQILNTPIIVVYRCGLYGAAFFLGYFVFSHDIVIERLKKWFPLFAALAVGLCVAFCIVYFGKNYADKPVNRSPLFVGFGWFACLAILSGSSRFADFENPFTKWMNKRSWGLYVFHYLGVSSVGLFVAKKGILPPVAVYLLSFVASFAVGYALNEIISRIPFFRWAVLGITKKKRVEVIEGKADVQ